MYQIYAFAYILEIETDVGISATPQQLRQQKQPTVFEPVKQQRNKKKQISFIYRIYWHIDTKQNMMNFLQHHVKR